MGFGEFVQYTLISQVLYRQVLYRICVSSDTKGATCPIAPHRVPLRHPMRRLLEHSKRGGTSSSPKSIKNELTIDRRTKLVQIPSLGDSHTLCPLRRSNFGWKLGNNITKKPHFDGHSMEKV